MGYLNGGSSTSSLPSSHPNGPLTTTPFATPHPHHSQPPTQPRALDDGEEKRGKYERVLRHFDDEGLRLPLRNAEGGLEGKGGEKGEGSSGLTEEEKMVLSREMMIRHLKSENWDEKKATKRLDDHIVWRRTIGIDDFEKMAVELQDETKDGNLFTFGYSSSAQPMLYMIPSRIRTEPSDAQVRYFAFVTERAIDLMVAGVEEVSFVVDLSPKIKASPASIKVMRQILSNMQTNYPERLGFAELHNIPRISRLLLNMMWAFIDPYTRHKIGFTGDLIKRNRVTPSMLPIEWGGLVNFEYRSEDYFPALMDICRQRRKEDKERWRAAGARVGLSEWEFRKTMPKAE